MKKFLVTIAVLAVTVMASAQNLEWTGPFGMPYVNLNDGVYSAVKTETFGDFLRAVRPTTGVELGTYFTPVWGAAVEGVALFGTPDAPYGIDRSLVMANGKVNISNLLAGYKGEPRRLEVVGVAGLGWGHNFTEEAAVPNTAVYNAGAEINVNVGKERKWQINVRPNIFWNNQNAVYPKLSVNDASARLTLGVTYKFGNRRTKSHNFVTNNYAVSQADYDILLARYEELKGREPQVLTKEVVRVEEKVVKDTVVVKAPTATVYFEIGKCDLTDRELARLDFFAKSVESRDVKIKITGSADTKTGSKVRNAFLAQARAETVKKILVNVYDFKAENITTDAVLDLFDRPESSRVAVVE